MMDLSEEQLKAMTDALIAGRKIEAIKIYREATGLGLKEAKEAVEKLVDELSATHPEIRKSNKSGCASMLAAGFLVGVAGVVWDWVA